MLTRSKCMPASEAADEKNWEMANVSDTFHPPTTVVAAPNPTLAQDCTRVISPLPSFGSQQVLVSYVRGKSVEFNVPPDAVCVIS